MPRPRFHNLPAEQQTAILDAALPEFAAHGFRDASLNRIIAAAGISKGSMYYYFDDKVDLYAHVLRTQVEALVQGAEPPRVQDAPHPDVFWAMLEAFYLQLMRTLATSPHAGALLHGWLTDAVTPPLRGAQDNAEGAMLPWLMQAVDAGQRIGAVRTDLPAQFIIAVATGMGKAMDTWLITRPPEESELAGAVHTLLDMMRRALAPAT